MGDLNENGLAKRKKQEPLHHRADCRSRRREPANGVILPQGGIGGGWMFYVKDGILTYLYNLVGLRHFVVTATQPLTAGTHQVRMEFAYDGGGLAKGGGVTLLVDGKSVGQGRVEQTAPMVFSADETSNVGVKHGSPMTPDVPAAGSEFNGAVNVIVIENVGREPRPFTIARRRAQHDCRATVVASNH